MENKIKSGKEILDNFFDNLNEIPNIDDDIRELLKRLYREDKLTYRNLSNELLELRKVKCE